MKAFTPYNQDEVKLRQLCRQLNDYGTVNCTFGQFVGIYKEWHLNTFKGQPVNYSTATFRRDWFASFLHYLVNYEI
jgi:hypothetical protein